MADQPVPGGEQPQGSEAAQAMELAELVGRFQSGSGWFYWIAGLSVVNSAITQFEGQWAFIIGLGITQVIDEIMRQAGGAAPVIGFVISLVVAGVFALFGVLARKRQTWAFYVGMVLYALDGLLFLLVQDWLSIGFHVFALYCIYGGLAAHNKLRELEAMQPVVAAP